MNRLALETSPYLRQHAENPVDWYPWGAFAAARQRESSLSAEGLACGPTQQRALDGGERYPCCDIEGCVVEPYQEPPHSVPD